LAAGSPLLEAQVVDAADSLTYDTHDVDDALGLGLITFEELDAIPFWKQAATQVWKPGMSPDIFRTAVIRLLIDWQVRDLVAHTLGRLRQERIGSVEDVRHAKVLFAESSPALAPLKAELERFLHQRVYRHYRVMRMKNKGRRILSSLFREYCDRPELLPDHFTRRRPAERPERMVGDYLAGMTDRFAQQEYLRLFHPSIDV
jgi:dGTPase